MRIVVYVFVKDAVPVVYTFENQVKSYLYPDLAVDFERVGREMI